MTPKPPSHPKPSEIKPLPSTVGIPETRGTGGVPPSGLQSTADIARSG